MTAPGWPPADGIGQVGREVRRAAVLLFIVGRVIVAQAEIEREFARHFPAVLRVEPPLLFSEAHV